MKLHEIREARAAKVAEARALLDTAKGQLNPEQQKAFDGLKAAITDLEAQEQRALFVEHAERRAMGEHRAEHRDAADLESRVSILRTLQAQMEGRSLTGAEAEYAQEAERRTGRRAQGVYVPLAALERRVNTTTTAAEIVPTDHRPDLYIGPLRNQLLARRLGVRVLSGLRGDLSIPKHGTGLSTGWIGEGTNVPAAGDMGFDTVSLTPKHAGGVCEMSRQLIQQSSPDIEALIRDELGFLIAKAIDSALILGGGANEPKGVLSTTGIQTANLATLSWQNVLAMLQKLDLVNASAANIVASTKVKAKLAGTLKATGVSGYLLEGGRMADLPVHFSNQVPEKAGSPATGRVIAGDWSQVMLGVWSEIDVLVNPFDSTAYARGGVLVRAMTTCDIAVRHPEAFVVADDVAL